MTDTRAPECPRNSPELLKPSPASLQPNLGAATAALNNDT